MAKKILVAVDLASTKENPVISKAEELKKLYDAEIHLIHVVERIYAYGTPPFPENVVEWQKEFVEVAKKKLQKIGHEMGVLPDNIYAPVGSPKELVIEKAEEIAADLIVIGSHSRTGLGYLLLGSTADGVVQTSSCDVYVVRMSHSS